MQEHHKPWHPLSVDEAAVLFANATFQWWIAGGVALELAVGHTIRTHADIDILVLRRDHLAVRQFLEAWDCWAADPPGRLRSWPVGEVLGSTVHDIWCRKTRDDDWRLQLMLDEAEGGSWISRRSAQIKAPLEDITRTTPTGIRYLAPHIQLFYKAKHPREKDEVDFDAALAADVNLNVDWLRTAIVTCYGKQHPWLTRLPE